MLAKLLKLFPLEALLKAAAQLLLDNQPQLVAMLLNLIAQAESTIEAGPAKFAWVKSQILPYLKGKASWVVDTAIHALVAFFKSKSKAA